MVTWGVVLSLELVTHSRHIEFLSVATIERGLLLFFVAQFFVVWSNILIKISICVMLLRFMQRRLWTIGLWTLMASLVAIGISANVTTALECTPPSAYWHMEFQRCWDATRYTNGSLILWCMPGYALPNRRLR
jgi:hypothetical protein